MQFKHLAAQSAQAGDLRQARASRALLQAVQSGPQLAQSFPPALLFRLLFELRNLFPVEEGVACHRAPVQGGDEPGVAVLLPDQRQAAPGHGLGDRLAARQGQVEVAGELDRVCGQDADLHPHHQGHAGAQQGRGDSGPEVAAHRRRQAGAQHGQPHRAAVQGGGQLVGGHQGRGPMLVLEEEVALRRREGALTFAAFRLTRPVRGSAVLTLGYQVAVSVEVQDVVIAFPYGLEQGLEGGGAHNVHHHGGLLLQAAQAVEQGLALGYGVERGRPRGPGETHQHPQGQVSRGGRGRGGALRVAAESQQAVAHQEGVSLAQKLPGQGGRPLRARPKAQFGVEGLVFLAGQGEHGVEGGLYRLLGGQGGVQPLPDGFVQPVQVVVLQHAGRFQRPEFFGGEGLFQGERAGLQGAPHGPLGGGVEGRPEVPLDLAGGLRFKGDGIALLVGGLEIQRQFQGFRIHAHGCLPPQRTANNNEHQKSNEQEFVRGSLFVLSMLFVVEQFFKARLSYTLCRCPVPSGWRPRAG